MTYLDENDPFYPGRDFPKLTTPQWIGETNVEAVVILAIDDMKEPERYEKFLRPILERLKQIDGRAPVSIMTVSVDPQDPQLQAWLKERLSIEVHTLTHPCPCLAQSNFTAAVETYNKCIELVNRIPGNRPVAFRMPCCDSMNSPSPRFYAEIFNRVNALGQFLTIDSSVMNVFTTNDSELPRQLVAEVNGRERFRKYLPFPAFTTTIEDYPYPYVIGKLCWEFPGVVPSDWEAQHLHGTNNPVTVADWKAALDATMIKQGVMNLIFHPHGWIRNDQIVELIDYAVSKYGKKVKFLTFHEAQERLDKNLLLGCPLRVVGNGEDNGVRLLDLNNDGFMDVILSNEKFGKTRVWNPQSKSWHETGFPMPLAAESGADFRFETGLRFGLIRSETTVSVLALCEPVTATASKSASPGSLAWTFTGKEWIRDMSLLAGLDLTIHGFGDRGVRLRDIDGDGRDELIVANESQNAIFSWSEKEKSWKRLPYELPEDCFIVDAHGRDNGLRFVDINEDGFADVIVSNEKGFSLNLFVPEVYLGFKVGWSREVLRGKVGQASRLPSGHLAQENAVAGETPALLSIPMITRNGSNNGAWFHSRHLWVQNEDTSNLPDKVDRRSFDNLLAGLPPPPLSPDDSLKAIRVRPGFKVELVAHEPLVQDPIAFEWGADGKLWVVEMGDYPLGIDGKGKPGGIVRFLEDTNHDGIYDKSTVFLDGLNFPTGIMPWGKGVIVSAAPEIFYAEDTDGDGKADTRKVLFTGFREGNQQHRLNGFDYGLDNWLYGANGDSGGRIQARGKRVDISGRDFRFRPADGAFEPQSGGTQYGRHRDDWGNWFGNNNATWLWHYWLPEHYVARNPYLPVRNNKRLLANYEDATRVFPISHLLQRFNDIGMARHVTSANSAMPYRDELFGPDFANSIFISEPVHNLVHCEILEQDGVSFTSHRADEQETEFLASTDNWFRPTMIKTGPDGALYLADMYRLVIEHPEWIPEDVKHRLDLRAGHDKGRIYRVYPANAELRKIPRLNQLDTAGLVAALDSPSGWQRDTVQRLLIERADKSAVKPLENLIRNSERPKTRLQALCTIDGLGAVTPEILAAALKDKQPAVREHALRISESLLRGEGSGISQKGPLTPALSPSEGEREKQLQATLLTLVDDSSMRVRFQLAFTLGEWNDPRAAQALAKLASANAESAEMQIAILSSAPRHLGGMLEAVLEQSAAEGPPARLLDKLLGLATATGNEHALASALAMVEQQRGNGYAPWQLAALGGMLDALGREGKSLEQWQAGTGPELRAAIQRLDGIFAQARLIAASSSTAVDNGTSLISAVRLLARSGSEIKGDLDLLTALLQPHLAVTIQTAALDALRRVHQPQVADVLIQGWNQSSPTLRPKFLQALLTRPEWIAKLLTAIEQAQIPAGQLAPAEQQQLLNHSQSSIRERAATLFAATDSDRQKVVQSYRAVAGLKGDQKRGADLFQKNCAVCHSIAPHAQIGPDLAALADKSVETLIEAILDPNRAVETRYVNYAAVTKDDREISGIIVAESANSITLRSPNGEETILRRDLKQLSSSGLSLMPDGFEKILSPQDLADVIAYLTQRPRN